MKTLVHVDQHVIRSNRKKGENKPALTVKTYKSNQKAHEVVIKHNGEEVGRFIYQPDHPLSCGAHVWFSTECEVEILEQEGFIAVSGCRQDSLPNDTGEGRT